MRTCLNCKECKLYSKPLAQPKSSISNLSMNNAPTPKTIGKLKVGLEPKHHMAKVNFPPCSNAMND